MEFYETVMGRKFFEAQVPGLIAALEQIATRLSAAAPAITLPDAVQSGDDILKRLYYGSYESESFARTEESAEQSRRVQQAIDALRPLLSPEAKPLLDNCMEAIAERDGLVAERAYEAGFRLAARLLRAAYEAPDGRKGTQKGETNG